MILIKRASDLHKHIASGRKQAGNVGFVPTMGALHEGHLSLIEASQKENGLTVCSIFVNPTQFNDPKDYEKYPVTMDKDIALLEEQGVDILFYPYVEEIYPNGLKDLGHYDLGYLETILEGKYRPGHFQGVCQVVHRLLEIVQPNNLYMGQKDYQQCMVVKRLLELTGLPIELHTCPTLREPDGLAMSSRNMRLHPEERQRAVEISRTLAAIGKEVIPGDLVKLSLWAEQELSRKGFKVDYVAIASALDLRLVDNWDGKEPLVTLAAAFLNEVRLIDNMLVPLRNE
ncbi:pantoate--beta-alanine ligase [Flavihumibacter rivuli]|uniref:pantoate--beta-alanine ligase n=1 Tax=Flavihumibacter rivuli TaxID=2838156 RepID=UPI001BDE8478|nr:pantoate--beta-alanine ligase [Flavihumibacter rivuli]ULQ57807.1 pantoate--beta-alanine ligase [Flavihumibacter rivuli]